MINFHLEGFNIWFSDDYKWAVYKRYSDNFLMLYKMGKNCYYDYTGFKFVNWDEIQEYIKNHSK